MELSGQPDAEQQFAQVEIRNLGFSEIRIVGVETTCNCLVLDGLPVTVAPREVVALTLRISSKGGGDVKQVAKLMFDEHGRLHESAVVLAGKAERGKIATMR